MLCLLRYACVNNFPSSQNFPLSTISHYIPWPTVSKPCVIQGFLKLVWAMPNFSFHNGTSGCLRADLLLLSDVPWTVDTEQPSWWAGGLQECVYSLMLTRDAHREKPSSRVNCKPAECCPTGLPERFNKLMYIVNA